MQSGAILRHIGRKYGLLGADAKAAAAKLSKQKSMMMGFFKKPSPKKTDQMTVEKDGIEVVGKGKGEEEGKGKEEAERLAAEIERLNNSARSR